MTRRVPSTIATVLTAALLCLLAAPTASAHPEPGPLDHRRDDLLAEMQDHLARWKTRPARAPTAEAPPAAPAPSPDTSDDISDGMPDHRPDDTRHAIADDGTAAHATEAEAPMGPAPIAAAPMLPTPEPLPDAPALPAPVEAPSIDAPPSSVDRPIPLGQHDAKRIAAAVLDETNAARARHGLTPVEAHPVLDAAAAEYAGHLARTGDFGHIDLTRAGMEEPSDRVRAAGGTDVLAAENLITETWLQVDGGEEMFVVDEARHQYSRSPDGPVIPPHTTRSLARSMVQRWLESPGHRRNILDAKGRQMGFGMAWDPRAQIPSLVAVQVFQRYHRLGEGTRAKP